MRQYPGTGTLTDIGAQVGLLPCRPQTRNKSGRTIGPRTGWLIVFGTSPDLDVNEARKTPNDGPNLYHYGTGYSTGFYTLSASLTDGLRKPLKPKIPELVAIANLGSPRCHVRHTLCTFIVSTRGPIHPEAQRLTAVTTDGQSG